LANPLDKLKIFLIPIKLNGIYYDDGECDIMNMDVMMMMVMVTFTNTVYPLQTQ